MVTRWDKFIIISVLIFAAILYSLFALCLWADRPEGVVVLVNGKEYAEYSLAEISGTKTVNIDTEFGHNVLEITSKGARMTEASCPDKTDIQCGEISKTGQMIVCVPNRVSVKIVGSGKSNVDKVAY